MTDVTQKADLAIARADRVMAQLDGREGSVRAAAKRERQRLNSGLTRTLARIGIAVGIISLATIAIGLILPIGMFGFLAAVGLAKQKWPEAIHVVRDLPRTASGKVQKFVLRQHLRDGTLETTFS